MLDIILEWTDLPDWTRWSQHAEIVTQCNCTIYDYNSMYTQWPTYIQDGWTGVMVQHIVPCCYTYLLTWLSQRPWIPKDSAKETMHKPYWSTCMSRPTSMLYSTVNILISITNCISNIIPVLPYINTGQQGLWIPYHVIPQDQYTYNVAMSPTGHVHWAHICEKKLLQIMLIEIIWGTIYFWLNVLVTS